MVCLEDQHRHADRDVQRLGSHDDGAMPTFTAIRLMAWCRIAPSNEETADVVFNSGGSEKIKAGGGAVA
jgi:hypothetical protein